MMTTGSLRPSSVTDHAVQVLRTARNSQERADRALELICEARGATHGHLCLVDDDSGLVLSATRGTAQADAPLLERARDYVTKQLQELPELETALISDMDATTAPQPERFEDGLGVAHRPVLLQCVVDGALMCAGVALLAADPSDPQPTGPSIDLIATIGLLLIQGGNTVGMRTRW
jgi:hypothetical protein